MGSPDPPRQGQLCFSAYCSTPSSKLLLSPELTHERSRGAVAEPSKMQLRPLCRGLCRVHGALLPPPPPRELRRYTPTEEDGKGLRDLQGQRRAVHREGLEQEGAPDRAGIWAGTGARAACTWGCGGPRVTTGSRAQGPSGWSGSGVGRGSVHPEPRLGSMGQVQGCGGVLFTQSHAWDPWASGDACCSVSRLRRRGPISEAGRLCAQRTGSHLRQGPPCLWGRLQS